MLKSDPRSLAGRPDSRADMLGQVLTPRHIARRMVRLLLRGRSKGPLFILDPAVGPGTFPKDLIESGLLKSGDSISMYDIDKQMISKTKSIVNGSFSHHELICADYLESTGKRPFDMAILNPPYIRQEWIDRKREYRNLFLQRYGIDIPGTANLYVYFLVKALSDLKPGGRMVCIVYDSWQYTKYGSWLSTFLEGNCTSMETQTIRNQPFDGRLIDATIISLQRAEHALVSMKAEKQTDSQLNKGFLGHLKGFKRVHELYYSQRGLRLKQANFFLTNMKAGDRLSVTPFVKKAALIKGYVVPETHEEAALLLSQKNNKRIMNELSKRLEAAKENPDDNVSILTWYKERPDSWFLHREAPTAPVIFNYYLRNRPKHIFNPNRAYSDNFYGLTPKDVTNPLLILALMNSTCVCAEILAHSRKQGSGLSKVQLYEYRNVMIPDYTNLERKTINKMIRRGQLLINSPNKSISTIEDIDSILAAEYSYNELKPEKIREIYMTIYSQAKG